MTANKRFTSIARRINRAWAWKLFWTFFWVDVGVLLLAAVGYLYHAEVTALGAFALDIARRVEGEPGLRGLEWVRALRYVFAGPAGDVVVPMRAFVKVVEVFIQPLLWTEGAIVVIQLFFGANDVRRLLRPLDTMAITAQKISEAQQMVAGNGIDEEKFHSLEDAILSIAPNRPDAKIATGDRELKGLEDAINALLARLHESYRQQARFVSDASHELRTPIAVIQGYAAMLDRWGKDDENVLIESIAAIKSESAHMKRLVEQLLFLARGDSGRQKLVFERFDLAEMMREVYEESGMIDGAHVWQCVAPEPVFCVGDADMLKQVARILTDNAAKYTPPGGAISLRALYKDGVPCFEVQDSGVGIAQEDIPKIFGRFFRADPARSSQSGGTGLGLSIAKWVVDRHSGYFTVLSRQGLGTRMAVFLPESAFDAR